MVPLGVIAGEEGREVILVTWDLELGAGECTMELWPEWVTRGV